MSPDWRFARQPFWLFSHLFAATVIVSFVGFGFWQLDRLDQRRQTNSVIESRSADILILDAAPEAGADGANLDYRAVEAEVRFVEGDLARVANRSSNGAAGEHVVAVVELADGTPLAVNRGFVPLGVDELDPVTTGPVTVTGWLRPTVERGLFGATDEGQGDLLPRFDTERVGFRLGRAVPPVWLQLATVDGAPPGPIGLPEPVPLPPLDDGPHLGYAVQWFIFATLGVLFYGLLLRRRAGGHGSTVTTELAPEVAPAEVR